MIRKGSVMRIATGGFEHETNTFCTIPVTEETIRRVAVSGRAYFELM